MNIVKARAAVEHLAKQLAEAMDAADRAETRIEDARHEALAAVERHHQALLDVERLHNDFLEAERVLLRCQEAIAQTNGQGSGTAYNPTIRIEPND